MPDERKLLKCASTSIEELKILEKKASYLTHFEGGVVEQIQMPWYFIRQDQFFDFRNYLLKIGVFYIRDIGIKPV